MQHITCNKLQCVLSWINSNTKSVQQQRQSSVIGSTAKVGEKYDQTWQHLVVYDNLKTDKRASLSHSRL